MFAKLRKFTVNCHICPLTEKNSAPTRQILIQSDIWAFFKNLSRKLKFHYRLTKKKKVLYMKMFSHLWQYLTELFLPWEMFHIIAVEKIKTHILCSITFSKNRAVYEIMSKTVVGPERPHDDTVQPMYFACWASRLLVHTHMPTCPRTYTRRNM
jgi:hypothetical protein